MGSETSLEADEPYQSTETAYFCPEESHADRLVGGLRQLEGVPEKGCAWNDIKTPFWIARRTLTQIVQPRLC